MYCCQAVDTVRRKAYHYDTETRYRVLYFKVVLNAAGQPVWASDGYAGDWYTESAAKSTGGRKGVLWNAGASHGRLVTMAEAERLTGLQAPAALDYLTEQVQEGDSPILQNYQKPKPVKPPKPEPVPPTADEIADGKAQRAEAKAAEYDRRIRRMEELRAKWAKKAKYHRSRAKKLREA